MNLKVFSTGILNENVVQTLSNVIMENTCIRSLFWHEKYMFKLSYVFDVRGLILFYLEAKNFLTPLHTLSIINKRKHVVP